MKLRLLILIMIYSANLNAQPYVSVNPIKEIYNINDEIKLQIKNLTNDTLFMTIGIEAFVNNNWNIIVKDVHNDVYTVINGVPIIYPLQKYKSSINLKKAFRVFFKPPPYSKMSYYFKNSTQFRLRIINALEYNKTFQIYSNIFHIVRNEK